MTPKDQAQDLCDKFTWHPRTQQSMSRAKQCAIICATEIIANEPGIRMIKVADDIEYEWVEYWEKVKEEIEKL